jgi:transcriptional regulator with XRE-family HTH domain
MSRLKQLREERGLTKEALAAGAEISYSSVQRLETPNTPNPTLSVARRIADVLGVTVDEVFPPEGAVAGATDSTEAA